MLISICTEFEQAFFKPRPAQSRKAFVVHFYTKTHLNRFSVFFSIEFQPAQFIPSQHFEDLEIKRARLIRTKKALSSMA